MTMRGNSVRNLVAVAALVASSLVGLGAGPAHAATTINVPAAQPTIQAAIEAASAGDTVVVAPGTSTPCQKPIVANRHDDVSVRNASMSAGLGRSSWDSRV